MKIEVKQVHSTYPLGTVDGKKYVIYPWMVA